MIHLSLTTFVLLLYCISINLIDCNENDDTFEAETFAQLAISTDHDEEIANLKGRLRMFESFCVNWRDAVEVKNDKLKDGTVDKDVFEFYFDIAKIYEFSSKQKAGSSAEELSVNKVSSPKAIKNAFLYAFNSRPYDQKVIREQLAAIEERFKPEVAANALIEGCKTVNKLRRSIEEALAEFFQELRDNNFESPLLKYTLDKIPCMTMRRVVFIDDVVCKFARDTLD